MAQSDFYNYANSFHYPTERGYLEPQAASGMMVTLRGIKPLQTDPERRLRWLQNQLGQIGFKPETCSKISEWLEENVIPEIAAEAESSLPSPQ